MKNNNDTARVMYEWDDRVIVTPDYTKDGARFLAQLSANAYRPEHLTEARGVWLVSRDSDGNITREEIVPTEAEAEAEAEAVSATSYIDPDTLALARIVASAEGITVAEALADQMDILEMVGQ